MKTQTINELITVYNNEFPYRQCEGERKSILERMATSHKMYQSASRIKNEQQRTKVIISLGLQVVRT